MTRSSLGPLGRLLAATLALGLLPAAPAPAADYTHPDSLSESDTLVAVIGDRALTLAHVRAAWDRLFPNERPQDPDPLRAREKFLDDLVVRHLLALEALRHPRELPPGHRAALENLRATLMKNRLYEIEVLDPSRVDRVDMSLFRREATRLLQGRAYLFPERARAQAWYARLVRGTPLSRLDELARSGVEGAPTVIDTVILRREGLSDSTARALFQLDPGRVSAPVLLDRSWVLFYLEAVIPRPTTVDLSNQQEVLKAALHFREPFIRAAYQREISRLIELEYFPEAIDTLLNRFLLLPPKTTYTGSGVPRVSMTIGLPPASEADSQLVLATSRDGEVTGAKLLRHFAHLSPMERPEVRTREELMALVDRVAADKELLRRAERMKLDQDPKVRDRLQRQYEGELAYLLYQDSVTARVEAPWDSVKAYFETYRSRYQSPETARLWYLVVERRELADSLLEVARRLDESGRRELAARFTIDASGAASGGTSEILYRGYMPNLDLEEAVFDTPQGEFGGPVPVQSGWTIFQVVDRQPAIERDLSAALPYVEQDFQKEQEETLLEEFLARLRERFPVTTHPERLRALVPQGDS